MVYKYQGTNITPKVIKLAVKAHWSLEPFPFISIAIEKHTAIAKEKVKNAADPRSCTIKAASISKKSKTKNPA
jgi:hypothetical protein